MSTLRCQVENGFLDPEVPLLHTLPQFPAHPFLVDRVPMRPWSARVTVSGTVVQQYGDKDKIGDIQATKIPSGSLNWGLRLDFQEVIGNQKSMEVGEGGGSEKWHDLAEWAKALRIIIGSAKSIF
jgi:hypothetical protein